MHGVEDGVRDRQLAVTTPGALAVEVGQDVGRATDAAVVFTHTSAELHATISTARHENHVVAARTRRVELLPLTVFHRRRRRRHVFNKP